MAESANFKRNLCKDDTFRSDSVSRSFSGCVAKLQRMVYRDTAEFRNEIGRILNELDAIDSSVESEESVANVLRYLCHLVPLQNDELVHKFCHVIHSLVNGQQLVLVHHCDIVVEYLLKSLKYCHKDNYVDIFKALATVVFENSGRIGKYHEELVGHHGLLHRLAEFEEPETRHAIVQCIENICIRAGDNDVYLSAEHQTLCAHTLLTVLQTPMSTSASEFAQSRTLVSALKGIQNLLQANKSSFKRDLIEPLLAALQVYMFFGLPNAPNVVPHNLSSLRWDDQSLPGQPTAIKSPEPSEQSPAATKSASKRTKARQNRAKKKAENIGETDEDGTGPAREMAQLNLRDDESAGIWATLGGSDSDYSDAEHGGTPTTPRSRQVSSVRVRVLALSCFHSLVKATDRRTMFAYWPSFIPDSSDVGGTPVASHSIVTVISKDLSPKVRVAGLSVLTALLDGSKQFLMAAEDSDQYRVSPFTSFSVVVGRMVKELHRCLFMLLSTETTAFVIIQILKCLSALIANVPYHRLRPGLLSSAVKQIRPYLSHRDPSIRVACLTCLGSVVSTPTPLLEVCHIMEPVRPIRHISEHSSNSVGAVIESGYASSSVGMERLSPSPGFTTPVLTLSGTQTPIFEHPLTPGMEAGTPASQLSVMSWVVRLCVRCIMPQLAVEVDGSRHPISGAQPLPVRLEALQLLALLSKGYFAIVCKCLPLMKELIESCLTDSDSSIQLHSAKLLDAIGSALLQQWPASSDAQPSVEVTQAVHLWSAVLNGPLQNVLQGSSSQSVRSTVCDCLSDIGPDAFILLSQNIQRLCITLLLGLSSDEEHSVRAAAIRALGCCILYPCLREDVSFVADTSNILITAASERILFVRCRVAWSLGNLSDALVLNRKESNIEFMEDFSSMLLSKLIKTSVQLCADNDKARSNAVRAVGNLLRYIPHEAHATGRLNQDIEPGLQAIIKNINTGSVKVRWNACYAIANAFGNEVLHQQLEPRLLEIFTALSTAAKNSKNFKVRISAVSAMAAPTDRRLYGTSNTYHVIWQSLVHIIGGLDDVDADFAEYKYRDTLVDQVCATLLHTICLINADDLLLLETLISEGFDILSLHLKKYLASVANQPEKAALNHLKTLSSCNDRTLNKTVDHLSNLLTIVSLGEADGATIGLTSGFRQMYD